MVANESPLPFACLWERWEQREVVEACTIVTTETHPNLA